MYSSIIFDKCILSYNLTPSYQGIKSRPWLGCSVGQNVIPIHQGCEFIPRSGHIQESTNECINKWNNKSMFLSFSLKLKTCLKINILQKNMISKHIKMLISSHVTFTQQTTFYTIKHILRKLKNRNHIIRSQQN